MIKSVKPSPLGTIDLIVKIKVKTIAVKIVNIT